MLQVSPSEELSVVKESSRASIVVDDAPSEGHKTPLRATYSFEEVLAAATKYFEGDELAANTWTTKYALRDNDGNYVERTPADMHRRLAREFAKIESRYKNSMSEDEIFALFDRFKYVVAQGSPMAAVGNPYKLQSCSNCFVLPSPEDSYGGILHTDQQQAQIMKRRGGVGFDISSIRPRGLPTANAAQTTDGIGIFMDRFSNTCREVAQGGRRGALMLTLDVHHPEVSTFINIKRDLMRVTGANISLRLSDEFLAAVRDGEQVQLRWPVEKTTKPVVEAWVNARELWDDIVSAAHACAEPGLLLWGNIIKGSPADAYADVGYKTVSTNPCAELPLSVTDSCRLMVVNLANFVEDAYLPGAEFDWSKFHVVVKKAQRLMDDLVDIELDHVDRILQKIDDDPESEEIKRLERSLWEKIRRTAADGRRTGLGVTAVGDAVAMVGLKYGSDESIVFIEKIYRTLAVASYESSIEMAEERGCFPVYDFRKEAGHAFVERVVDAAGIEVRRKYETHGRRNIANLTTAPTGSVSLLTQTSSGIEPVFEALYTRKKKVNPNDVNARVDEVDDLGDKWTKYVVRHHGLKRWQDVTGHGDEDVALSPYWGAQAEQIDWVQRVKLQAAAQTWVDHAISSCLVAGESLVLTDRGLLDISEIAGHAAERQFAPVDYEISSINKEGVRARITEGYNNGLARVLRIHFPNGYEIACTPNHKLVVLDEGYNLVWREASQLKQGDVVVGRKGLNLWNETGNYLSQMVGSAFEYERRTNAHDLCVPKRMTPALARFLGYMCSDGFYTENSFGLSQQRNDAAEDFAALVFDLFRLEVSEIRDERADDLWSFVAHSREVVAFLRWIGIQHHDELVVPLAIRRSGKHCVREFVRGLTLDGHVSEDNLIVMTSVCLPFLRQVQMLLLNYGIEAGIDQACKEGAVRKFPSGKEYSCKEAWTLRIAHSEEADRYLRLVGFAEARKQEEASSKFRRSARNKLVGEIPDFGLRERFRQTLLPDIRSNRLYEMFHSLTCADKRGRWLARESIKEMQDLGLDVPSELTDCTFTFRPISEISDGGLRQTYDISVPDGHAYLANGLISHNTLNLPEDVSVTEVQKIYMAAWEAGCKGITVYRTNSRSGVLVKETKKEVFAQHSAPKRPDQLPCDVHRTRVKVGEEFEDWIFFVGLLEGKPFEIFGGITENVVLPKRLRRGAVVKRVLKSGGKYDFVYGDEDDPCTVKDVVRLFNNPDRGWATRMVSLALRHGTPIQYIAEQLQRDKEADMFDFAKSIARVLKSYIPDGSKSSEKICPECSTEGALSYQEGCLLCRACGYSKCG